MFKTEKPEINYIGKLVFYIGELGYLSTDIYPIASLDSKIINKSLVEAIFQKEIQNFRLKGDKAKQYNLNHHKDTNETLRYEMIFTNGYDKKLGFIYFEIFEESKLREKKDFLGVSTI